jgi:hypothetical protein
MSIFKSRKFWIAVLDAVVSIVTMAVTLYLANDIETRGFVLGILAAVQPVFVALINGIATEDAAAKNADAVKTAASITAA